MKREFFQGKNLSHWCAFGYPRAADYITEDLSEATRKTLVYPEKVGELLEFWFSNCMATSQTVNESEEQKVLLDFVKDLLVCSYSQLR